MKSLYFLLLLIVVVSCGTKQKPKDEKTPFVQKDTTPVITVPDKPYLRQRPEEFKEFFMLTDVVPFTGKVAKKKDVKNRAAVFNMDSKNDPSHKALNIRLPFFAFLKQPNNQRGLFVVIMQAEVLKGDTMLGYKQANGLFGLCKPNQLDYFESQKASVFKTLE